MCFWHHRLHSDSASVFQFSSTPVAQLNSQRICRTLAWNSTWRTRLHHLHSAVSLMSLTRQTPALFVWSMAKINQPHLQLSMIEATPGMQHLHNSFTRSSCTRRGQLLKFGFWEVSKSAKLCQSPQHQPVPDLDYSRGRSWREILLLPLHPLYTHRHTHTDHHGAHSLPGRLVIDANGPKIQSCSSMWVNWQLSSTLRQKSLWFHN